MNNQETNIEKSISYIRDIDFTPIIKKLVNQYGWRLAHAEEICDMYRKFLILKLKYGRHHELPPSEDIDEFWHQHILDTKNYRRDCEAIFGLYLDHYPFFGIDGVTNDTDVERAFAVTLKLYAQEFGGEPIYEVRGMWAKIDSCWRRARARKLMRAIAPPALTRPIDPGMIGIVRQSKKLVK